MRKRRALISPLTRMFRLLFPWTDGRRVTLYSRDADSLKHYRFRNHSLRVPGMFGVGADNCPLRQSHHKSGDHLESQADLRGGEFYLTHSIFDDGPGLNAVS